jgi:hypothetical protein
MQKTKTMSFIFSGFFIGLLIILLGLSVILKEVFQISFPFFRVFLGILLIWWGIRIITKGFWTYRFHSENTVVFDNSDLKYSKEKRDYNIAFGSGTVDLGADGDTLTENRRAEVNVAFGRGVVRLKKSIPTVIEMNTAFGQTTTPERMVGGFGSDRYKNSTFSDSIPHLKLKTNVVFGRLDIEEY